MFNQAKCKTRIHLHIPYGLSEDKVHGSESNGSHIKLVENPMQTKQVIEKCNVIAMSYNKEQILILFSPKHK